jgi:hypothetical protein
MRSEQSSAGLVFIPAAPAFYPSAAMCDGAPSERVASGSPTCFTRCGPVDVDVASGDGMEDEEEGRRGYVGREAGR